MFRKNVAAVIKCDNQFLGCYRSDHKTWQCVQGGIEPTDLSIAHAITREIQEELGLDSAYFSIQYQSKFWRRYHFTEQILKNNSRGNHIGQDQLWFLVELEDISKIRLEQSHGEFSKVQLFEIEFLMQQYSYWKRAAFYDFCREIGLK